MFLEKHLTNTYSFFSMKFKKKIKILRKLKDKEWVNKPTFTPHISCCTISYPSKKPIYSSWKHICQKRKSKTWNINNHFPLKAEHM